MNEMKMNNNALISANHHVSEPLSLEAFLSVFPQEPAITAALRGWTIGTPNLIEWIQIAAVAETAIQANLAHGTGNDPA